MNQPAMKEPTELVTPIKTTDFGLAIHMRQTHYARTPAIDHEDELTNPRLWSHNAPKMRIGDHIECAAEDHTYAALLLVTNVMGQVATTRVLWCVELEPVDWEAEMEANQPFYVQLCGPLKYCIISRETGERMKENIATKAKAEQELADYLKALNS